MAPLASTEQEQRSQKYPERCEPENEFAFHAQHSLRKYFEAEYLPVF
jgi:hypothetical protein